MDRQIAEAIDQIGYGHDRIAMLIDGRNCAYRAIYANRGDTPYHGVRYASIVVMLRFIHTWMERFQPFDVHVFWDAPKSTLWRRKIMAGYKERDNDRQDDIREELAATQEVAQALLKHMNVRQYLRKGQEADDLIYAACRVFRDRPCVVVSSDGDFTQLQWHLSNVLVYEPKHNKLLDCPRCDPVIQKALMGDKGDRIPGYDQIGPVKSERLTLNLSDRLDFLGKNGKEIYYRNMLLVDLNLCPYLLTNQMYIERISASDTEYSRTDIMRVIQGYRVNGAIQEYERIIGPYRLLGGRPDQNTRCPECGLPQAKSASGWSCQNGHGYGQPSVIQSTT